MPVIIEDSQRPSVGIALGSAGSEKSTPSGVKLCKCGNPARPGQRTCLGCHASYQKRYREGRTLKMKVLLQVVASLTQNNFETRRAFNARFRSRRVLALRPGFPEPVPCEVSAFKADGLLSVRTRDGETFTVALTNVIPDPLIRTL